jgi:multidrug transporter EmrE-like cation transporter
VGSFLGFALTVVFLAKVLEVIPTSIAYTVWTGAGCAR